MIVGSDVERSPCTSALARELASGAHTGQSAHVDDDEWEAKAEVLRATQADRARRLVGYESVVASFERLLFERDPMGLNFETNTDEYRPEAETIALRFLEDEPTGDPALVAYEEFASWFGEGTCGPRATYERIGPELWSIWTASSTAGG